MGQGYLLNSNTIIDFCAGKLPNEAMKKVSDIVNSSFTISPIVKIEVLGFNGPVSDMQKLEGILEFANIFYIDDIIIQKPLLFEKHTLLNWVMQLLLLLP